MSDKIKLLRLVQKNDIKGMFALVEGRINRLEKEFDFNFKIDGTTLLHEAVSAEMICFLLYHKVNIMLKNSHNKSPEYVLKKKIKALAKERAVQKKQSKLKSALKLNGQLLELKNALKMLKSIRSFVAKGNDFSFQDLNTAVWLNQAFKTNSFKKDLTALEFKKIANAVANKALKTKKYDEKTAKYLENAGFDKKKVKKVAAFIQTEKLDCYLMDEKAPSVPKMLYRGTINPKDQAKPLDHFGSFRAARERLDALERAINEKRLENFERLGVDLSQISYQIKPILLKVKNPFRIPEMGNHELKDYKRLMLHVLLMNEKGREAVSQLYEGSNFSESFALKLSGEALPKEFSYIFDEPFKMPMDEVKKELLLGGLYDFEEVNPNLVNNINREHLAYQRMIRYFERQGYDGFVYKNGWEDTGIDSYICFRPNSVVEPLKASKKELILPVEIDEKSIKALNEESKISSLTPMILKKEDARKLYDVMMRSYYGKQMHPVVRCIKKTTRIVREFFKKSHCRSS